MDVFDIMSFISVTKGTWKKTFLKFLWIVQQFRFFYRDIRVWKKWLSKTYFKLMRRCLPIWSSEKTVATGSSWQQQPPLCGQRKQTQNNRIIDNLQVAVRAFIVDLIIFLPHFSQINCYGSRQAIIFVHGSPFSSIVHRIVMTQVFCYWIWGWELKFPNCSNNLFFQTKLIWSLFHTINRTIPNSIFLIQNGFFECIFFAKNDIYF